MRKVEVRRRKLDPSLKAHLVSNFDCEKRIHNAFNLNLVFCLSLRHYVSAQKGRDAQPALVIGRHCIPERDSAQVQCNCIV